MNKKEEKEVLSYLGHRGKFVNESLLDEIRGAREELRKHIHPFRLLKKYSLKIEEDGLRLGKTRVLLTGKDARRYFGFSKEIYVVCVSLGSEASSILEKEMEENIGRALVLDAVSSAMVTGYMAEVEEEIEEVEREKGLFLTKRFGAGYGDLPLSIQKEVFEELELSKEGFLIEENHRILPEKTLISLIGVLEQKEEEREEVCTICKFKEVCRLKKQGARCVCLGREEEKEEIQIAPSKEGISYEEQFFAYQRGEILLVEWLLFLEKRGKTRKEKTRKEEILLVSVSKEKNFGKKILRTILEAEGYSIFEEETGSDTKFVILSATYFSQKEEIKKLVDYFREKNLNSKILVVGGMFSEKELEDLRIEKIRDGLELLSFLNRTDE